MDFLIGMLLMVLIIILIFNYVSISTSDSNGGTCGNNLLNNNIFTNNMFGTNQNNNQYPYQNQSYSIPSPVQSNAPSALNKKINLNNYTYDYSQHFFV